MKQLSLSTCAKSSFLSLAAICLVSFLTYFQVYSFEFCFDDYYSVLPIKDVEKLSSIVRYFTEPILFLNPTTGVMEPFSYFRPIATSTLTVDLFLFGKERPGILHVENLFLHSMNACLFFFIVLELLKTKLPAFFSASLYAVFPLFAEMISIYHYRVDLVTSFFIFFTLLVTIKNGQKSWSWQVAILFTLAMLSKEAAISLLVLIPLFRHFQYRLLDPKELFIALGVPMLLYWPLRYNALGAFFKVEGAIDLESATHDLTVIDWFRYIFEGFFQKTLFMFEPFTIPPKVFLLENVNDAFVGGGILLFVLLVLGALCYLKRANLYSVLATAILVSWFPVSSLLIRIPDFISPRHFYYPAPWIVLLLTFSLFSLLRKNMAVVLALVFLVAWGSASYYQKFMYKNNFAIKLGIVAFTPDHAESLWTVANEYEKRREYELALQYFYRFLNSSSRDAQGIEREQAFLAHIKIADIHLRRKEYQKALYILDGAQQYFPDRGTVYLMKAFVYVERGDQKSAEETMVEGEKHVEAFQEYQKRYRDVMEKRANLQKDN